MSRSKLHPEVPDAELCVRTRSGAASTNEATRLADRRISPGTEVWKLQATPHTPGLPTAVYLTDPKTNRQFRYLYADLNLLSAVFRALVAFRYERMTDQKYSEKIIIEFCQIALHSFVVGNLTLPLQVHVSQRSEMMRLVGQEGQTVVFRYQHEHETPELANCLATIEGHIAAGALDVGIL